MKKCLLVSNKLFHYRVSVYNYFWAHFKKHKIDFSVLASSCETSNPHKTDYRQTILPFSLFRYLGIIKKESPDAVILFLNLKDSIIYPLVIWLKAHKIPIIYWNHGVNLQDPDNTFKYLFFHFLHSISDTILLYSPNEIKYIAHRNRKKVFIAPNTLNFTDFPAIENDKASLRVKHSVPFSKVVLFVGRIEPYKQIGLLLDTIELISDGSIGLIIIGAGLQAKTLNRYNTSKIMYRGSIYDKELLAEYFSLADICCIPGAVGLGINQAMYYGLPVVTTTIQHHGPEITYLHHGENGLIVEDNSAYALKSTLVSLLNNPALLHSFSEKAKKTILTEANIDKMFQGFLDCFNSVQKSNCTSRSKMHD